VQLINLPEDILEAGLEVPLHLADARAKQEVKDPRAQDQDSKHQQYKADRTLHEVQLRMYG
jgi:hypothetical protein